MDLSESSLVRVFEMLVSRLNTVEQGLDSVKDHIIFQERRKYGELDMSVFGYRDKTLRRHLAGSEKDPDAAPEKVCSIFLDFDNGFNGWSYFEQLADGRFDYLFDKDVDLDHLKSEELRRCETDEEMLTPKEVNLQSSCKYVIDWVTAKLVAECGSQHGVKATHNTDEDALIMVSKHGRTVDEWCKAGIAILGHVMGDPSHTFKGITIMDFHPSVPTTVLTDGVGALKSWAASLTPLRRRQIGRELLENGYLKPLYLESDIREAFGL
jgi:hypothetical protein